MKHLEHKKIVLIGASTGGPGQIEKLIKVLPQLQDTCIIIAQHITKGFTESFANRLNNITINNVFLAKTEDILEIPNIYICCGHTSVIKKNNRLIFQRIDTPKNAYNPDINLIFNSFTPFTKEFDILSIILTGIGEDGVEACKELTIRGARSITESSSSAIVDGMPCQARKKIKNIEVCEMENIIHTVKEFCN